MKKKFKSTPADKREPAEVNVTEKKEKLRSAPVETGVSRSEIRKRKIWGVTKIVMATVIAASFAILFLMPIVLTITNSFMASSEISANYGSVFATNDSGGKVYISEKVNLKFIPDMAAEALNGNIVKSTSKSVIHFKNPNFFNSNHTPFSPLLTKFYYPQRSCF